MAHPVSPVLVDADLEERVMSKEGYADLPVIIDEQGGATSRWLLTPEEVERISRQGYLYVRQVGGAGGVQPIAISADPPIAPITIDSRTDDVLESEIVGD